MSDELSGLSEEAEAAEAEAAVEADQALADEAAAAESAAAEAEADEALLGSVEEEAVEDEAPALGGNVVVVNAAGDPPAETLEERRALYADALELEDPDSEYAAELRGYIEAIDAQLEA